MRINVLFREEQTFNVGLQQNEAILSTGFGDIQTITEADYNNLINKPKINNVELIGALSAEDLGLGRVLYDTTANWEAQGQIVTEAGVVYVYSDAFYLEDDVGNRTPIAGIKIGDGNAYLNDMPFVTDAMTAAIIRHVTDTTVHITPQERAFWNNKVSSFLDHADQETLVLSKTQYEQDGSILTQE